MITQGSEIWDQSSDSYTVFETKDDDQSREYYYLWSWVGPKSKSNCLLNQARLYIDWDICWTTVREILMFSGITGVTVEESRTDSLSIVLHKKMLPICMVYTFYKSPIINSHEEAWGWPAREDNSGWAFYLQKNNWTGSLISDLNSWGRLRPNVVYVLSLYIGIP